MEPLHYLLIADAVIALVVLLWPRGRCVRRWRWSFLRSVARATLKATRRNSSLTGRPVRDRPERAVPIPAKRARLAPLSVSACRSIGCPRVSNRARQLLPRSLTWCLLPEKTVNCSSRRRLRTPTAAWPGRSEATKAAAPASMAVTLADAEWEHMLGALREVGCWSAWSGRGPPGDEALHAVQEAEVARHLPPLPEAPRTTRRPPSPAMSC